jgi:hypothetical protein
MKNITEIISDLGKKKRSSLSPPLKEKESLQKLEEVYGKTIPAELIDAYSITGGGFLQINDLDSWLLYGPDEVLHAPRELHVDFVRLEILPIIDCKDNDFICYDFKKTKYLYFNILDEAVFGGSKSLATMFEERLI